MTTNSVRIKKIKNLKRIYKWKKRSVAILSVFVFLIAFVILFIYTSIGVRLTTYVLNKFLPELKITQVEGTFHNLHIQGLSLQLPGVNVQVNDASLSLTGLCLLKTKICINQFNANGVNVSINTEQIDSSPSEEPSTEIRFELKTPLPIDLKNTHLTKIKVTVDDMQFGMSDFTGKATWVNNQIYVYPAVATDLSAIFADNKITNAPVKATVEDISLNEKISQLFNQPLIDSLPQVNIPLNINVTSLTGNNWLLHMGGQDYRFNNVVIQTNIVNSRIIVKQVDTDATTPYASGHASVSGEITLYDDWPVLALVKASTEQNQFDAQFSGKLLGELLVNTTMNGSNQMKLSGHINFIEKYLPIMTQFEGKHIQWPMEGQAQYELNDFDASINGNVQQYQMSAKGHIKGEQLANTMFDIAGTGTNQGAIIDHGIIKLPQGEINIAGTANWQQALQWDTDIKLNNVDITKELPNYPIRLNGQLKTTGSLERDKWAFNLSNLQLKGNIKHADFSTSGNLFVNSENKATADDFAIKWGKNQLNLNGSSERGSLLAKLNFESLSLLIEGMQGSIAGNIKLNGAASNTTIDTNLLVNSLSFDTIKVAKANLVGKVEYKNQVSGNIKLTGQSIELPSKTIKKATIDLSGSERQHTLTVNIDGEPASLKTSLTGQLDKARTKWSATIPHALLNLGKNNNWQLAKSMDLAYDVNNQIPTINSHCWINGKSTICLDKQFSLTKNSDTSITLKEINLSKLPIPNDGETKLTGNVNGKVIIQFKNDTEIPSIKANITSHDVYIQQMVTSQSLPLPFDLFKIDAEFNEQQAKLDWIFGLNKLGKISGNIVITDPINQKALSGQLNIDHLALAIINPLLDSKDYAKGAINGKVKFSGSLNDPLLTGNINLQNSEIKSSQLPIDVKSAKFDVNFTGKSSTLKGILATQAGNVNINGNASWNTFDKWQASLTVNGAAMEVSVPPMIAMTIVPDIKISATQDELALLGKVSIPKGKITVESLPSSSIDVSPDEVMLDINRKEINPQKFGMKIFSHLEIAIGDQVMVDAFGLKASLKGNLIAAQTNKGLDLHGEVLIPTGRFHAYGQDLVIHKGIITFSGSTDQAMLDIEAIRNPESMDNSNIMAGIRVTGSLESPKIEVFSDPAMSQQEALSYLIRGQGLDSAEQSDSDMMTALLVGIGTAKTGKYIGDIGNAFGIKNLTLDTQGAGNNSKVVVSGYILPNLQLKYGVGIFDSLATFTLRYRLMPSLYLDATSSLAQTLDLIYQFDF
ncbi:autotransporter assembly complex protein TamB [Gilliamella sp. ESL0250]|uniref:autotransporter assembly complex protein TamB n=1 Tax=Gilliamella sp. ESL0250 TaxID=2705036 RepID=UPI001580B274|nr:translocation/assembly module TamB domain-containing protein [Gilliamella sp. ESL0250]NUF48619.1 translocation/assembly module TamB [Gilliamella sp. ESL0250]